MNSKERINDALRNNYRRELEEKNRLLKTELDLARKMYPDKMQMVKNALETVEKLTC